MNAVRLLSSRRGDARVAPPCPCPTTSCVWRSLPDLTSSRRWRGRRAGGPPAAARSSWPRLRRRLRRRLPPPQSPIDVESRGSFARLWAPPLCVWKRLPCLPFVTLGRAGLCRRCGRGQLELPRRRRTSAQGGAAGPRTHAHPARLRRPRALGLGPLLQRRGPPVSAVSCNLVRSRAISCDRVGLPSLDVRDMGEIWGRYGGDMGEIWASRLWTCEMRGGLLCVSPAPTLCAACVLERVTRRLPPATS